MLQATGTKQLIPVERSQALLTLPAQLFRSIAIRPQARRCRGSHLGSYLPGLHPSPERGITTITGSEGNAPESAARQGTRLRGPAFASKYQNFSLKKNLTSRFSTLTA